MARRRKREGIGSVMVTDEGTFETARRRAEKTEHNRRGTYFSLEKVPDEPNAAATVLAQQTGNPIGFGGQSFFQVQPSQFFAAWNN